MILASTASLKDGHVERVVTKKLSTAWNTVKGLCQRS